MPWVWIFGYSDDTSFIRVNSYPTDFCWVLIWRQIDQSAVELMRAGGICKDVFKGWIQYIAEKKTKSCESNKFDYINNIAFKTTVNWNKLSSQRLKENKELSIEIYNQHQIARMVQVHIPELRKQSSQKYVHLL